MMREYELKKSLFYPSINSFIICLSPYSEDLFSSHSLHLKKGKDEFKRQDEILHHAVKVEDETNRFGRLKSNELLRCFER